MSIVEFMQAAKKAITTPVTFQEVLCHTKDYDEHYTKEQLIEYGIQCAAKAVLVERERCAVSAWVHYMDTCKKSGIGPTTFDKFCSAGTIRKGT